MLLGNNARAPPPPPQPAEVPPPPPPPPQQPVEAEAPAEAKGAAEQPPEEEKEEDKAKVAEAEKKIDEVEEEANEEELDGEASTARLARRQRLKEALVSLGGEPSRLTNEEMLVAAIAGGIRRLQNDLADAQAKCEELENTVSMKQKAGMEALAAFDDIKKTMEDAAASAQARSFTKDVKVERKLEKAPLDENLVPVSELNKTKALLNETTFAVQAEKEAKEKALMQVADLEESLADANERADRLWSGLKEVASLAGATGIGGLMAIVMSEESVLENTKRKINELKRRR